ncbi:MAG TPA: cytochrome c1 [Caulobacteraceae bacterium]|jgi:ubiquinol-cytochrome c reductase cytochrome c1 subunit
MLRKALILAAALGFVAAAQPSFAEVSQKPIEPVKWSFEGPFGRFDQEQLQRGYKVYHDVCSACHAMNLMSYRNLGQEGGPFYDPKYKTSNDNAKVKAIAKDFNVPDIDSDTGDVIKRPATPADTFVKPFPNEAAARASNGGALPPDLSLIAKAREDGPNYIYHLLTGYEAAPAGLRVPAGKYYNPYMPGDLGSFWSGHGPAPEGGFIAMPLQLTADRVTYDDGVKATPDQEAQDVVTFLAWASEPHADERKQTGVAVLIFLFLFAGVVYASYRRLWKDIDHG